MSRSFACVQQCHAGCICYPYGARSQGWKDPDGRLEFWGNVHGLDYSSMADLPLEEASVEVVGRDDMVTERCLCQDFNIETVADEVSTYSSSL